MNSEETLEDLLAKTRLNDRAAFARLYSATSAKLFGICLRILKERPLAEEALQEVYMKIWRGAQRYDSGKGKPITWMARIAHNHAIDRLRALKPTGLDLDEVLDLADSNPGPEQNAIANDNTRAMNACLDELDEAHAHVIRMAYLDGYTYDEISAENATPVNTIKTWVRRSLSKLKDCLNR